MLSSTHIYPKLPDTLVPPAAPLGPRVWAVAVTLVCSVFLVGLGGCFLVGVLGLLRPALFIGNTSNPTTVIQPLSLSGEELTLMWTLYVLVFLSFLGSLILFILAVRGLWRIL